MRVNRQDLAGAGVIAVAHVVTRLVVGVVNRQQEGKVADDGGVAVMNGWFLGSCHDTGKEG